MKDSCSNTTKQPAARLGDVVKELMDSRILNHQAELRSAEELWRFTLPSELSQHCKIAGISGGQLLVRVDSPSYMYELQLTSRELLKELRRRHPRTTVEKIKFVPV